MSLYRAIFFLSNGFQETVMFSRVCNFVCRMPRKKRPRNSKALKNLTAGNPSADRFSSKTYAEPKFKHVGTSMRAKYTSKNPSASTRTKIDKTVDKAVISMQKIDNARSYGLSRTQNELIMLIQFVIKFRFL